MRFSRNERGNEQKRKARAVKIGGFYPRFHTKLENNYLTGGKRKKRPRYKRVVLFSSFSCFLI